MSYSQKPPKNKLSMVKQKRIQTLKIYCVTNMIEELQGCGFLLAKGYWVKVTPIFITVFEGRNECYCYYYCIWFAWNIDVKSFANYLLFKMLICHWKKYCSNWSVSIISCINQSWVLGKNRNLLETLRTESKMVNYL